MLEIAAVRCDQRRKQDVPLLSSTRSRLGRRQFSAEDLAKARTKTLPATTTTAADTERKQTLTLPIRSRARFAGDQ